MRNLRSTRRPGRSRREIAAAGATALSANDDGLNSPQRLALLEAAAQLFAERGYAGVTMDELAVRLRRKKATLYHYVATKEELIVELFLHGFRVMEEHIWPIVDSDLRPDEKMRRVIHKYTELTCTNVFFRAVSLRGAIDLPEPHKTRVLRLFRKEERRFEAVIIEGQRMGLFRLVPPRLMVLGFLGMCVWCDTWYEYAGFTVEEIGSRFALLFERGWMTDGNTRDQVLPRAHSIQEAMVQVSATVAAISADVERLRRELERARLQLEDGLAPYSSAFEVHTGAPAAAGTRSSAPASARDRKS